jgi:hypothetical protein
MLLHNEATAQNKFLTLQSLMSIKQKPSETIQTYKLRLDGALEKLHALEFSMEDIAVIHFLTGLQDRYSQLVDTLCLRGGDLTLDYVYREIMSYDQRHSMRKEISQGGQHRLLV